MVFDGWPNHECQTWKGVITPRSAVKGESMTALGDDLLNYSCYMNIGYKLALLGPWRRISIVCKSFTKKRVTVSIK